MRPTWPLLGITALVGMAGGLSLAAALTVWASGPLPLALWLAAIWTALGLGALGGLSSFFHMHKIQAARFILRRLRSSWLSREALTTGLFVGVLGILAIWPRIPLPVERWGLLAAAVTGLVAMFVTAMLYATIPAMKSWHSPLTVVSMMGVGVTSGGAVWLMLGALVGHQAGVSLVVARDVMMSALVLLGLVKALQWRLFSEARGGVRAGAGTGLPLGPYRLQDTGTTTAPYRTQTQTWPLLHPSFRRAGYIVMLMVLCVVPLTIYGVSAVGDTVAIWAAGVSVIAGALWGRWLFFADSTHSSRVWFQDEDRGPSRVATDRGNPALVDRFGAVGFPPREMGS